VSEADGEEEGYQGSLVGNDYQCTNIPVCIPFSHSGACTPLESGTPTCDVDKELLPCNLYEAISHGELDLDRLPQNQLKCDQPAVADDLDEEAAFLREVQAARAKYHKQRVKCFRSSAPGLTPFVSAVEDVDTVWCESRCQAAVRMQPSKKLRSLRKIRQHIAAINSVKPWTPSAKATHSASQEPVFASKPVLKSKPRTKPERQSVPKLATRIVPKPLVEPSQTLAAHSTQSPISKSKASQPAAHVPQSVVVIVPLGAVPGMQMLVQIPDGQQLMIKVPEGVFAGQALHMPYNSAETNNLGLFTQHFHHLTDVQCTSNSSRSCDGEITTNHQLLTEFYRFYAPDRMDRVASLLGSFDLSEIHKALLDKYGLSPFGRTTRLQDLLM
jgi:hypothetical protein